jgi:hypothetical protein
MNCKPGDLAFVFRSDTGLNLGKIVRCVRLHDSATHDVDGVPFTPGAARPRWVIDPPLVARMESGRLSPLYSAPDDQLRPIRDNDGEDEMLRIAGKPREVETL